MCKKSYITRNYERLGIVQMYLLFGRNVKFTSFSVKKKVLLGNVAVLVRTLELRAGFKKLLLDERSPEL